MDTLWSPWRYQYIKGETGEKSGGEGDSQTCVFCSIRDRNEDERTFVVHRARHNYIVLNLYPYTTGHLLIVPYQHVSDLDGASKETTDELMDLTKRSQTVLRETYHAHGFNLGMNLGRAAGAGVAEHIHMHVMPRWMGDANFMTTVAETRVIPEDLSVTFDKLRGKF